MANKQNAEEKMAKDDVEANKACIKIPFEELKALLSFLR
jgi:hypothetical protein